MAHQCGSERRAVERAKARAPDVKKVAELLITFAQSPLLPHPLRALMLELAPLLTSMSQRIDRLEREVIPPPTGIE